MVGGVRGKLFIQRIVDIWKSLLKEMVESITITMFERYLDTYLNSQGMVRYSSDAGKWD